MVQRVQRGGSGSPPALPPTPSMALRGHLAFLCPESPYKKEAGQVQYWSQPFCPLDSPEEGLKNTDAQVSPGNSETSCSRWGLDLVI